MTSVKSETTQVPSANQQNDGQAVKKIKRSQDPHGEKKEKLRQAVDWLTQAFPLCFNIKEPKPLKIEINDDILNQWVYLSSLPYDRPMPSRLLLRKAVGWYATRSTYYAAFDKATHRIDLEGKQAQEIGESEKSYAKERLTAMKDYYEKNHKPKKKKDEAVKERL
jgi:ProP effector